MNEKKTVYNALFSGQEAKKVELASVADLKKSVGKVSAGLKAANKIDASVGKALDALDAAKKKAFSVYEKNDSALSEAVKDYNAAFKLAESFEKEAKKLGISPSEVGEYRTLQDLLSDFRSAYKEAEGANEILRKEA